MFHGVTHRFVATARPLAVALVLLALVYAAPAQAFAAKVSKKAAAKTAVKILTASQTAAIAAMQADFGSQIADYVGITRELHRTEDEAAQVTSQIASGQAQLDVARSALSTRAVELYRTPSVGLLESLLTATSVADLFKRVNYLAIITEFDARLLKNLRLAQTEEAWLQEGLQVRVVQLQKIQATADKKQAQLLVQLAAEQARAAALNIVFTPGVDSTQLAVNPSGSDPRSRLDRSNVVSESNFRGGGAMTAADVQAFLDKQPGALKSFTGRDYAGVAKTAAQMISEACLRFNINPKIVLATLQKEQSLLTTKNPSQSQYNGAMGAGMPDSGNNNSRMQGFGNQIYWGAQKFDKNARDWSPGKTEPVDGTSQGCANEGTFAQYRYTPHYSGVTAFWTIFWRYFGDPLG